jgi:hypothetical protein
MLMKTFGALCCALLVLGAAPVGQPTGELPAEKSNAEAAAKSGDAGVVVTGKETKEGFRTDVIPPPEQFRARGIKKKNFKDYNPDESDPEIDAELDRLD